MHIKKFILLVIPLLFFGVFKIQAQSKLSRADTAKALQNVPAQQLQQLQQNAPSVQSKTVADPVSTPTIERQNQSLTYLSINKPPSSNVFGSEFFSSTSLSFEPNLRIATPSNYVLGPDDELIITVSGYQETNIKLTVQPEGTIFIPQAYWLDRR